MDHPSSVGKTNNRTDQLSLAQPNLDGTPNLQDTTTVWDLGVKKTENNAVTYSKRSSLWTMGPSSASNSDPASRTNIGQQAKLPTQAKEDGTPFLEDETPLAKHIIERK